MQSRKYIYKRPSSRLRRSLDLMKHLMYNTNKQYRQIEEMAKGQRGLKWPPLYKLESYRYINLPSTKKIRHQEENNEKKKLIGMCLRVPK